MDTTLLFENAIALLTLTGLEIVLGIDNLVFVAVISARLPKAKQKKARRFGLTLAWVTRLLLLATAVWISHLTHPLLTLYNFTLTGRDIFLVCGGLFLLAKATKEIHEEIEPKQQTQHHPVYAKLWSVITQIAILDIIFSLDSVLTAIGLTDNFWIMAIAITIAIILMILASEPLAAFISKHPTIKMLAFSFLILIGVVLIADGLHFHIPRGYIYFAVCFSLIVEALNFTRNTRVNKKQKQRRN